MAPPWLNQKQLRQGTCRCAAPFRKSGLGFCQKRRPFDCCHFPSRFSSLPSSHSSPVSSRVSRIHLSRPDGSHAPSIRSIKDLFPYYPSPLFLSAWHPVCLRASRVNLCKLASFSRQHRNTTRLGLAGQSILTECSALA